jgi:TetR/AcrR family transcriptional regulator, cholesterol catabolism regulator
MVSGPGRYDDILESFTRHIAEIGYDGVNFGMVAAELGVSKGTIVHHFGTKDRILAALHESYMRRRLAELELMLEWLHSPSEQFAAILHAFVLYQVEDRDATVAFQREIVRLADQDTMAEGAALRQKYLGTVRAVIRAGIDSGVFRPVDLDVDALLVFGAAQWAWTWFRPDGPESAEQVASAFVDLVMGSLLINRRLLPKLAASDGRAAQTVKKAIREVALSDTGSLAS